MEPSASPSSPNVPDDLSQQSLDPLESSNQSLELPEGPEVSVNEPDLDGINFSVGGTKGGLYYLQKALRGIKDFVGGGGDKVGAGAKGVLKGLGEGVQAISDRLAEQKVTFKLEKDKHALAKANLFKVLGSFESEDAEDAPVARGKPTNEGEVQILQNDLRNYCVKKQVVKLTDSLKEEFIQKWKNTSVNDEFDLTGVKPDGREKPPVVQDEQVQEGQPPDQEPVQEGQPPSYQEAVQQGQPPPDQEPVQEGQPPASEPVAPVVPLPSAFNPADKSLTFSIILPGGQPRTIKVKVKQLPEGMKPEETEQYLKDLQREVELLAIAYDVGDRTNKLTYAPGKADTAPMLTRFRTHRAEKNDTLTNFTTGTRVTLDKRLDETHDHLKIDYLKWRRKALGDFDNAIQTRKAVRQGGSVDISVV